ncbi:helix-turn-helix domain-containing protein [Pseudomonas soli]|uniref:helix-turn-helix domain-containing protein n=1 Tax=Pseudomonas soli TaxID=1306993 RepID=UPI00382E44A4
MTVKEEIAIALRAIRQLKGARYDALMGAISQNNLSLLEQGKTLATLPTLLKIADSLNMHPLALLALALGLRNQSTAEYELNLALKDMQRFYNEGGLLVMEQQQQDGSLKKRTRGTKANAENVEAVMKLKALGKTQTEVAKHLGLPLTTVHRYWRKVLPQ